MIRIPFFLLTLLGIATVCYTLPAAHRLQSPRNIAAALLLVIGTVMMLLGSLLTMVPGFFNG